MPYVGGVGYGIYAPPVISQRAPYWPAVASASVVGAGLLLLAAGFLPWLRVGWVAGLMGGVIRGVPSDFSGVRADGTGSVVALCGCAAVALVPVGYVVRRAATAIALSALPGGTSLLACLIFALRQRQFGEGPGSQIVHVTFDLRYGWYVALIASLILLVTGLTESAGARRRAIATAPDQS